MKSRKIQTKIPLLEVQGRFLPETVNAENRTVEMVFTTSMAVRSFNWDVGVFNEILSMKEEHIRLERFRKGAPLLDSHDRYSGLSAQLGVVESVRVEGEKLVGTVRFSKRQDVEPIFQDVIDGIIRNGSIGYKVYKYNDETASDDKLKTLRGIDWEPVEMSLVTIPADHNAQVRADDHPKEFDQEIIIENTNERTNEMKVTPAAAPADPVVDAEKIRQEERDRSAKISRAVRQAKLPEQFAEELTRSGVNLENALLQIQEKWAEVDAQKKITPAHSVKVDIGGGLDETQTRREGAAEAVLARHFPQDHKLTEKGHRFQNRSALELCRMIVEMNGINTTGMGTHEIIKRAFHSTSDFTAILESVSRIRLQKAYESVPQIFRQFGVEGTLKDFKVSKVVALGEAPGLEKLGEGGEIKMGTLGESGEEYRLFTYAKGLAVTRELIINDDLGAFGKLAAAFGRAAAHLENRVALKEAILDNPAMGDTKTLFHADHNNLVTGTVVSKASVSGMKAKMRKQTDDKGQVMELSPKLIMSGPDNEDTVAEILAGTNATAGFNVHARQFQPVSTALISNNAHYLIADPNQVEGLEYSYLEGARGLQSETLMHPDTLGIVVRNWLDFGAKVINWRAFVKNPGA